MTSWPRSVGRGMWCPRDRVPVMWVSLNERSERMKRRYERVRVHGSPPQRCIPLLGIPSRIMETETITQAASDATTDAQKSTGGKKHKTHDSATMTTHADVHRGKQGDKDSEGTTAAPKEKQKRIAACDVCRLRRVKCVKLEGEPRCKGCVDLNRGCTYEYMPKKPGPPNP